MTLEECYSLIKADYKAAKSQLVSEAIIEKFMIKYLNEPTMQALRDAVKAGDIEESFRTAHTLKGVALNLALKQLHEAASELTEQLRSRTQPADEKLMQKVEEAYELVISGISRYVEEKSN